MTSRTVLATCSVMPLTLAGAIIAAQFNRPPVPQAASPAATAYRIDIRFRGRVQLYDTNSRPIAVYRSGAAETQRPAPGGKNQLAAYLSSSTFSRILRGTKRQPLYDANGELTGYTELIPATRALPEYSVQSGGINGWNKAFGYFDTGNKRLDWSFTGVGQVRFRYAENDKPLWRGTAHTLSKTRRAELWNELTPREFSVQVGDATTTGPDLTLTEGVTSTHITGYTSAKATLPDGTPILIDVLPPLTQ